MDYYTEDRRNVEPARVFIKLWLMETENSTATATRHLFPTVGLAWRCMARAEAKRRNNYLPLHPPKIETRDVGC